MEKTLVLWHFIFIYMYERMIYIGNDDVRRATINAVFRNFSIPCVCFSFKTKLKPLIRIVVYCRRGTVADCFQTNHPFMDFNSSNGQ